MLLGCVVGAFFTGMLAHKLERLSRMSSMITRTLTPLGKPLCWSLLLLQLSAVLSQGSPLDKLDGVREADVSLDGTWHFQIPAPEGFWKELAEPTGWKTMPVPCQMVAGFLAEKLDPCHARREVAKKRGYEFDPCQHA
jgi:hypothetical protein